MKRALRTTGTEDQEQAALFTWAKYNTGRYPVLKWLHAIPNGGKRDPITAARLITTGVKAGVPDIHLPVPAGGYHGLYIEMKVGYNTPTEKQREWLAGMEQLGHRVFVCYSWGDAARKIEEYLKGQPDGEF